jgi:hypothetical protein
MTTCPKCGEATSTSDYCDQCGAPLDGTLHPPVVSVALAASPMPPAAPVVPGAVENCPSCGQARDALELFCEHCGYDFLTGTTPAVTAVHAVFTSSTPSTPSAPSAPSAPSTAPIAWEIEVAADASRWDAQAALRSPGAVRPDPTVIALVTAVVMIGRKSTSRRINPDVDLTALTDDPAASHRHAQLTRADDGTWWITDLGSSNGTIVQGEAVGTAPRLLRDGDVIEIGAWTTISVRSR